MAENLVIQSIMSENVAVKSTTTEKRKRGQNFTAEDKDLLVKLLVNYRDIILNKKTDSATNEAKQKAWSDVTNAFNSIARVHRTKDSLLKLWENMKQRVEYYQTKGTTVCPIDTMEQVRELLGRASTGLKEELTQDSDATLFNGESSEVSEMIIPEISYSTQEDGAALEMRNDEQMPKIPKLDKPEQSPTWSEPEKWARPDLYEIMRNNKQKASSFVDLMMGRCTLDDVMQEFKMNGTDSPYTPDEDGAWHPRRQDDLSGFGPSGAYLRQKSWPEPERTPVTRLPPPQAPRSNWLEDEAAHARIGELRFGPSGANLRQKSWPEPESERSRSQEARDNWLEDKAAHARIVVPDTSTPIPAHEGLTAEQMRVLFSLPDSVLYPLLRDMEQNRMLSERKRKHPQECRFCKNNGERESYYRSHTLKDAAGRVRCPVLRAFVCRRCGARGDYAHTIKYCPLATDEERYKSAAMMRSVRQASGRRRASPPDHPELVMFGEAPPSLRDNAHSYARTAPLDPRWAALEQKLML